MKRRRANDEQGDEGGSVRDLIAGRAALIVIDMQKGGLEPSEVSGISHMAGYQDRIDRVVTVVDECHRARIPVIFFQEIHRRDLVDFGRELDGTESIHCLEGDPGTDLVDELRPGPGDYLIQKRRYSCFIHTDLDIVLRGLGVQTLLLAGNLTNVCVHYTFADAHQRDYHVRVLEDCVGGSDVPAHIASLEAMEYLQTGARRTSDEVLAAIRDLVPA
jgi:nicotinamidase-related amidase